MELTGIIRFHCCGYEPAEYSDGEVVVLLLLPELYKLSVTHASTISWIGVSDHWGRRPLSRLNWMECQGYLDQAEDPL